MWRTLRTERKIAGLKAKLQATQRIVVSCDGSVPWALVSDLQILPQEIAELETLEKQLKAPNADVTGLAPAQEASHE